MKTLFGNQSEVQKNNDIANDLSGRDYICEGQQTRTDESDECATICEKSNTNAKTKKQKFLACYNMFF